jgi:hypothetical protein
MSLRSRFHKYWKRSLTQSVDLLLGATTIDHAGNGLINRKIFVVGLILEDSSNEDIYRNYWFRQDWPNV